VIRITPPRNGAPFAPMCCVGTVAAAPCRDAPAGPHMPIISSRAGTVGRTRPKTCEAFAQTITPRGGAAVREARRGPMLRAGHCRQGEGPHPLSNLQQRGWNRLGNKRRAMPRIDGKKGRPPGMVWRAPPPVANSRVNARMPPITVGNPLPEIGSPPPTGRRVWGLLWGKSPQRFGN